MSDALVEGVSGAIGGCIATVATYPLSTIVTLKLTTVKSARPASDQEARPAPKSTAHEIYELVRTQGWSPLFRGLGANLAGTTVSQGVYFYLYSLLRGAAVRRRLGSRATDVRGSGVSVGESLLIAALAGAGNVLVTNPIWVIATRMQASRQALGTRPSSSSPQGKGTATTGAPAAAPLSEEGSGSDSAVCVIEPSGSQAHRVSALGVARSVWSEYGLGGFWNGCAASLVMVVNPTIQYALYEWLLSARQRLRASPAAPGRARTPAARPGALEIFALSALAKAGATLVTYPMQTIKTRMMSAQRGDADMHYRSISHAVAQIATREGPAAFYQGLSTKIVQSMFAAALLFMVKEEITNATEALLARPRPKAVA